MFVFSRMMISSAAAASILPAEVCPRVLNIIRQDFRSSLIYRSRNAKTKPNRAAVKARRSSACPNSLWAIMSYTAFTASGSLKASIKWRSNISSRTISRSVMPKGISCMFPSHSWILFQNTSDRMKTASSSSVSWAVRNGQRRKTVSEALSRILQTS